MRKDKNIHFTETVKSRAEINISDFVVLNLGFAKTTHHWKNRDISSPFLRIYYVIKGRARLHLPEKDLEAVPGNMYLLPYYLPHTYECDPDFEFYYLFFLADSSDRADIFDTYTFPTTVKGNHATQLLFENYCHLYPQLNLPTLTAEAFDNHPSYNSYIKAYMQMENYEKMQLHGFVEILMSYFVKHAEARLIVKDERISLLLGYIMEHLGETITVKQLADKACLTESYLVRTFRKGMGVTPLQYVIKKKIQYAQALLLSTDKSIQEISRDTGFADVSYFIRLFKKNLGFTPQEYRNGLIG
ncbi:MAG: AraC family transcriptional regulator [Bacteroidales bacterium]|nr:AraC family transcriptional regulator [Bacteroidales bacterium]MCM1205852.1 AraC family transcriptional regulator [Bacillota bacterium]MCM1509907.1 AraC family transcriptional regulator [Clostridium sp.]